jgi:beta-lactamase class A
VQDLLNRRRFTLLMGSLVVGGGMATRPAAGVTGALQEKLVELETRLGARLGAVILDTTTGREWRHRPDERFPMCSTFKLLACAAVLARVDAGEESLDRRIRFQPADLVSYSPVTETRAGGDGMMLAEICTAAMTRSDNTAGNLILASLGGPGGVTAFARSLDDRVTRLDRWETELNEATPGDPRDTTTPAAMAGNLRRLVTGEALSTTSRAQLTEWLVGCKTGANRLRGGLPASWKIGDKTGNNGKDASGDIAVAWPKPDTKPNAPILIAAYTQGGTPSAAQIETAFARIGRMVAERLT